MNQPRRRKIRVFTWVILAINVLFLVWIIAGVAGNSGNASNCAGLDQQTCNSAKDTGTAIGVALIVFLWAAVDVILGIIWLVTRRREPQVVYVQQPQQAAAMQGPPPGWYPHPQNPQLVQWWDGYRYTGHVQTSGR